MRLVTLASVGFLFALSLSAPGQAIAEELAVGDTQAPVESERPTQSLLLLTKQAVPIEGEFGKDWKQSIPLESPITSGESVTLWVEDGWLAARRNTASGAIDWQVFLCPIVESTTPRISVRSGLPYFEVTYGDGPYFIRDSDHIFRCLRMLKSDGQLMRKADIVSDEAKQRGTSSSGLTGQKFAGLVDNEWYHVVAGPGEDVWNLFVRLNPNSMGGGSGVQVCSTGLTHWHHGETWLVDDGELVVANRTLEAFYLAEKQAQAAKEAILAGKLPPIDATEWLNTDGPLDWEKLKGKVVLVDFWGTWCGPCVAKLPKLQPLHEKYAERGLVILAIHSSQAAETCADFIRDKGYAFPVAIDTGKTAESFAISAWPTYFLIDRDGKLVQSFAHDAPTDEVVAELIDRPN